MSLVHSYKVITDHSDLYEYVALKHLVEIQGYITSVFLPIDGSYDPETREGSVYNNKDAEYRYNLEPDFECRIAYLNPQVDPRVRGSDMMVSETNTAYTLNHDIVHYSKLLVNYGQLELSYKVDKVELLRDPNAKEVTDESLVRLGLVLLN